MPIYQQFEKLLEKLQIRTAEVSNATGISASTFSDWKNGKSYLKTDKLQILAEFFKVPIEFFLTEEGD